MNPFKTHPIRLRIWGWRHEVYDSKNKMLFKVEPLTGDRFYMKELAERLQFMVDATNDKIKALGAMEEPKTFIKGFPEAKGGDKSVTTVQVFEGGSIVTDDKPPLKGNQWGKKKC